MFTACKFGDLADEELDILCRVSILLASCNRMCVDCVLIDIIHPVMKKTFGDLLM